MEGFYLEEYLKSRTIREERDLKYDFKKLCNIIRESFIREWYEDKDDLNAALQLQKKAIIGYENETAYFKEKIKSLIAYYGMEDVEFPKWYESLPDAIYHENWGMAGIAQWFSKEYKDSSSAKIIGDRIYFMKDGRMIKMPQKISADRRKQLVRAFLLLTPDERMDKEFHEIYLLDGTRITVFGEQMTKQGQDVIIFRRYLVPTYTFEEQAARGTIPENAIPLFISMVETGYNVAFTGAVRTAKTTFLSTWQSYEDSSLEGVMVETDPEIPMHILIPDAPIVQLIADNERLRRISKNLLRSDADYFILAEARDGNALDTAIRIANKGTRRMKITFHCRDPEEFPYDVANEIVNETGANMDITARKVAMSFDYVFHFIQLKNKNMKRLRSIYELSFDRKINEIEMIRICNYDFKRDSWKWSNYVGRSKRLLGKEECPDSYARFVEHLSKLAEDAPLVEEE